MTFLRNISDPAASDAELLAAYRQSGEIGILGELYQRYMDLSYGVCLQYLEDSDAAKDAVMTVFEELVDKLRRHEPQHFKNWLYTVVKNHCLMQLRSRKRIKMTELDPERMQPEQEMHQEDREQREWRLEGLEKCLETLSADQKMTVELFYLREKCYKEIVDITGLDWNKVRSLIQNGRRNLKICMEKTVPMETTLRNRHE